MENKKTRSFYYKASRDIISTLIGSFFTFIGFFIMSAIVNTLHEPSLTTLCQWTYIGIALIIIIACFFSIYAHTFSCLEIGRWEVVYRSGWISKSVTSIPAYKIRSCTKSSGPLQRICGTMNISITTAGDTSEIHFCNITNGEFAYKMLRYIAMHNE